MRSPHRRRRASGQARLIAPLRSERGHRQYSHYQLRIAARELVDQGMPVEAACRIVILEEAQRINAEFRRATAEQHDNSQ
ncbi:MerR family DNA-binding transcriptional regulator [Streptomyces sp. NPDC048269]|uniref:MerR family DNA-binding transcriptional regulator n=1 Tax=Streptomyces sp. NPDC048269 TaxID=3155753 RepID=UPI003442B4B6